MNSAQISKLKKDILALSSKETNLIVKIKDLKNSNSDKCAISKLENKREVYLNEMNVLKSQLYNLENR